MFWKKKTIDFFKDPSSHDLVWMWLTLHRGPHKLRNYTLVWMDSNRCDVHTAKVVYHLVVTTVLTVWKHRKLDTIKTFVHSYTVEELKKSFYNLRP